MGFQFPKVLSSDNDSHILFPGRLSTRPPKGAAAPPRRGGKAEYPAAWSQSCDWVFVLAKIEKIIRSVSNRQFFPIFF